MTNLKNRAFDVAYSLYNEDVLSCSDYEAIRDGLEEIETLQDRDEALEEMWRQFIDIPINPETKCIEDSFMDWRPGINQAEILQWFDKRHSKGVAYLLYRDGIDRTVEIANLYYLKQLCIECDSETCAFNPEGICKFPFVGGRTPGLNDDGCTDYTCKEK